MRPDPLALQAYRAKRDRLKEQFAKGEITQGRMVVLYRALVDRLMRSRGHRIELDEKDQDGDSGPEESGDPAR
jgi:hypothetical protein